MVFQGLGTANFITFGSLVSGPGDQGDLGIEHDGLAFGQMQNQIRLDPLSAFGGDGILRRVFLAPLQA